MMLAAPFPYFGGYDTEHDALLAHGWTVTEGKAGGGAGYSANGLNGRRERLWLSPACIGGEQGSLFSLNPTSAPPAPQPPTDGADLPAAG
jgi:hypothetical protein